MDWLSLIPALISGAGAIFGSNEDTTTTSTTLTPEMQALVKELMQKAGGIYTQQYPQYPGQRVAGPTASRTKLDALMPSIASQATAPQNGQYATAINSVMNRAPVRVQLPTLVSGGPTATMSGGTFGNGWSTNPQAQQMQQPQRNPWAGD